MYNNYNNYNSYNSRSLFSTTDNYKLPSFEWQKRTELINSFNNNLVDGFKSNLTLYSPDQDLKLFNNLDLDAISTEKVNFNKVNANILSLSQTTNKDVFIAMLTFFGDFVYYEFYSFINFI